VFVQVDLEEPGGLADLQLRHLLLLIPLRHGRFPDAVSDQNKSMIDSDGIGSANQICSFYEFQNLQEHLPQLREAQHKLPSVGICFGSLHFSCHQPVVDPLGLDAVARC
jgi:hypothetical protein